MPDNWYYWAFVLFDLMMVGWWLYQICRIIYEAYVRKRLDAEGCMTRGLVMGTHKYTREGRYSSSSEYHVTIRYNVDGIDYTFLQEVPGSEHRELVKDSYVTPIGIFYLPSNPRIARCMEYPIMKPIFGLIIMPLLIYGLTYLLLPR